MITLHRLGHEHEPFQLNPDLIVTVEANPDTVITLTTGAKTVVAESPAQVAGQIEEYRVQILSAAMRRRHRETAGLSPTPARPLGQPALSALEGGAGADAPR